MQMLFQQHLLLTRRMRHCFTLILISFHMKRKQDWKRCRLKNVIIVGGTPAVSSNTANQIKSLGISIKRIAGSNRYDTAARVAKAMGATSKAVILNGFLYADAPAVIPYAAKNGYQFFFTNKTSINSATTSVIKDKGISSTVVVGGTGSISNTVYNKLPSPTRISGSNRYELAANIVQNLIYQQAPYM